MRGSVEKEVEEIAGGEPLPEISKMLYPSSFERDCGKKVNLKPEYYMFLSQVNDINDNTLLHLGTLKVSRRSMVMRANVADEARASRVEPWKISGSASALLFPQPHVRVRRAAGRENARRGGVA